MNNPKILLLDLETAPAVVYTWGLWDVNIGINQIVEDCYVLCWCAKWLGEKQVLSDSLIYHKDFYKSNPKNDRKIAESIWKLINKADIVVTHNGNNFDLKWINTLFIKHHLKPVSPFKSIDTKVAVKRKFRFTSTKMDFICKKLDLGRKINTSFELWEGCMKGSKECWDKMVKYCKQDVVLLEKLYLEILPFIQSHPNLALYRGVRDNMCPNCGSKELTREGYEYTTTCKYQRYVCKSCGKWSRGRDNLARTRITGV